MEAYSSDALANVQLHSQSEFDRAQMPYVGKERGSPDVANVHFM
jgi:hypothetical protein